MTALRCSGRAAAPAALALLVLLALGAAGGGRAAGSEPPGPKAVAASAGGRRGPRFAPRRVIVKADPRRASALAAGAHGLKLASTLPSIGAGVYDITSDAPVEEVVRQLSRTPGVSYVEPDYLVQTSATRRFTPNDPLYPQQWHLPKVKAPEAWPLLKGQPRVRVCHTDSGVLMGHPDLRGVVDKGWNFVPADQQANADNQNSVKPGTPQYYNYNDTYGHGTMTGGIIAALTNNGMGVASTAFGVKLLVCRFIWDDGGGWMSDAIKCWGLCDRAGATIYTNSWGKLPGAQALRDAMLIHQKKGHLMVVASGNDFANLNDEFNANYPASFVLPCQINVGATKQDDRIAAFSNWGTNVVQLGAPGEAIWSTGSMANDNVPDSGPNTLPYSWNSGTSFSTPIVSGLAALMQSRALSRSLTLTYKEYKPFILSTVDEVPALKNYFGTGGRLNMEGAAVAFLRWLAAQPLPSPSPRPGGSPFPYWLLPADKVAKPGAKAAAAAAANTTQGNWRRL
eukprot:scaffold10.g2405.t1